MRTRLNYFLLIFVALADALQCCAQPKTESGLGDKVIFEDDFRRDAIGTFPAKWRLAQCDLPGGTGQAGRKKWKIEKYIDEHALSIQIDDLSRSHPLVPNVGAKYYLGDNFAVDYDFSFGDVETIFGMPAACAELFFYLCNGPDSCGKVCVHIFSTGQFRINNFPKESINFATGNYPVSFSSELLHHFSLTYKKGSLDCYIDQYNVASIPDCKFSPCALSLGCMAQVKYMHFRITSGTGNNDFSGILTGKKFVTHAILFDVNRSTIQPRSMGFIKGLADFLRENPSIKLEIDGHTDSDGEAIANMALARARADEIKKQLVQAGIESSRLTTKGFGATKPLKPNTTPEGKAENRRVEFIKW